MENHDTDIHELNGASPDFHTELAKQLQRIVPEAIADGKVDVVKLSELLQEDVGDTNERFGLFWPGKKRAMRAAQEPTTATLKPAKDLSKDWDTTQNIFIEGDNLEVLKLLQKQYHSSIKMVYIDPPYNTGKDFVYPDNFQEGLQNYLEFSKQVDEGNKKISTNTESVGRYHSNWLNMMYPRLKLARNLMTDEGVVFISIDDNEVENIKKICNEIYGEDNFVSQFPWRKRTAKSDVPFGVSQDYEWIICFAKTDKFQASIEGKERKYYESLDFPDRPWRVHDMTKQTTASERPNSYFTMINPKNGDEFPADPNKTWRITKDTFQKYYDNNEIVFPGDYEFLRISKPVLRYFKDKDIEKNGDNFGRVALSTKLPDVVGMSQDGTKEIKDLFNCIPFPFPKPSNLLKYLFSAVTKDNDIILDFFAGSGTTAHAVMKLNAEDGGSRRHIQVQLPEPTDENSEAYKAGYRKISDIARERINRAGEKIKADFANKLAQRDTPLDTGYRTYKLSDTNFTKWQSSYTADVSALQQRLDLMRESSNDYASEQDLLTEIMLKIGLPLITKVEPAEINGLVYYRINDSLLIYLNEKVKPNLDQLRSAADKLPSKLVILEDAFQGDDQLKTNLHQICKTNKIELWTV